MNHPDRRCAADVFKAALDLDYSARAAFLDAECLDDAALRAEVESLLTADARANNFMAEPPGGLHAWSTASDGLIGQQVGGYRVVRRIAAGGMGTVYEAVQEGLGRTVALKIVRGGSATEPALRRFDYEAKFLARLRHPAIAQIYEVGTYAIGGSSLPFFAMEHITNARTIVEFARVHQLSTHQRLELFVQVCEAVQYAHLRGVIHRDLKPSNVLVSDDSPPTPKVIDFGVARLVEVDIAATSMHTAYGLLVGTLQYMSPEQCGSDPQDVDVRSDVYSLGIMLYELLAGQPPYDLQRMSLPEATRVIREANPPRLSALNRALRGDLETIARKALEKERDRRYPSAGELAEDLRRYQRGEPIAAKRDNGWYVLRKSLQRYRRAVMVAVGFLLLLSAAAISLSVLYARQGRLLVDVKAQRDKAEEEAYAANIAAAEAAITSNDGGTALSRLHAAPRGLRQWEWNYLAGLADQSVETRHGPPDSITSRVRISPSGEFIAAMFWIPERERVMRIWARSSPDPIKEFKYGAAANAPFEFSETGDELHYFDTTGAFVRLDVSSGQEIERRPLTNWTLSDRVVELSSDGRLVAYLTDQKLMIRDSISSRPLHEHWMPQISWLNLLCFDTAHRRFALGLGDGTILLHSVGAGQELTRTKAHQGIVYGLAFNKEHALLATTGGESGELKLWDVGNEFGSLHDSETGPTPRQLRLVRQLYGGGQRKAGIAFSHDGSTLAAPSEDKTIRFWSVADGVLQSTLLGHSMGAYCIAYSADDRFLISGARGGEIKLWDLHRPPPVRACRDINGIALALTYSKDGSTLYVVTGTEILPIDVADGRIARRLPWNPEIHTMSAIVDPESMQLAACSKDGAVRACDIGVECVPRNIGRHDSPPVIAGIRFGPRLFSADARAIVVWDWPAGQMLRRFDGPGDPVQSIAVSADGSRLALGLEDGKLVMCDASSGVLSPGFRERPHVGGIACLLFSPDGNQVATGSSDGVVCVWDVASRRLNWSAAPRLGDVWCLDFSPDGRRLAVGGRDRSVRLFDAQTGRELLALRGPTGTIMCLAFSPDGGSIAAASWAGEVFMWNSLTGRHDPAPIP